MNSKPVIMRKQEPQTPTWGPATDTNNALRFARNWTYAMAAAAAMVYIGSAIAFLIINWPGEILDGLKMVGIAVAGFPLVVVFVAGVTWMVALIRYTLFTDRSTYGWSPKPPKPVGPRSRRRFIPFKAGGQEQDPIVFDELVSDPDEPAVDGLPWTVNELLGYVRRAFERGLTETAWKGVLENTDFRRFRDWLAEIGVIEKQGRNRNAPYTWAGPQRDVMEFIERELSEDD